MQKFYKEDPFVNIFCSTSFRKEFKRAKDKYRVVEKGIKDHNDASRKIDMELRNIAGGPRFTTGRAPMGPGIGAGMPPGMPGMTGMMPPGRFPLGMPPPPFPSQYMGTGIPMGPGIPIVPAPMPGAPADGSMAVKRLADFLKDKDTLLNKDPTSVKKVAASHLANSL